MDFNVVLNASSENNASSTGKVTGMALALLTVAGEGDIDGAGLAATVELELLTGSVIQPAAAKVAKAKISPRVVYLIDFILEYLGY